MRGALSSVLPDLVDVDVAFACSLASAAGGVFILATWMCNRAARCLFFLRLIACLALANLLSASAYMMSFVEWRVLGRTLDSPTDERFSQTWCLVQALLIVIFEGVRTAPHWHLLPLHGRPITHRASPPCAGVCALDGRDRARTL